jgi:hypothetical protein
MAKKIRKFLEPEVIDNSIKSTDVWVVFKYSDYEIDKVYLNKADAEKAAELKTKEYYDYYRGINKNMTDKEYDDYHKQQHTHRTWEVKSLYDAIDLIREYIHDDYASHDNEDY